MSKTKDQEIKEEVLGVVQNPQVTGGFYVDCEIVSKPLVQEGTVIRACCLGCGYCLEHLESGAKHLAKLAGVQEPTSWQGYYFEAQRCPVCDSDYCEAVLKAICGLT